MDCLKVYGLTILLAMTFAQGAHAEDPGITDTEIKIGAHTSESGNFASFSSFPRAMTAYFDAINEKGGINGRKIKFIRVDSAGEPAKTAIATRKLVDQDRIFAMVGGMGGAHQASYKYLVEKGVPDLFFSDFLQSYVNPFNQLLIPGSFSYAMEGGAYAKHALQNLPGKTACFLVTDNAAGTDLVSGFKKVIEADNNSRPPEKRIKIGSSEKVDRLSAQANSQILNLKKAGCDLVVTSTSGGLTPSAITYAFSQGFKPQWYVAQFNINPNFINLLPDGGKDGIISGTVVPMDETYGAAGWNDYAALMTKNNIPKGRPSAAGYATAELFVETLKRAGKAVTRDNIITAAESLGGFKCGMCTTPVALSKSNHWTFESLFLVMTKNGTWKKL